MARPSLAVPLAILALVTAGECLNCKVCIPPLAGDKASQKESALWRANISRTFQNKAESDFQICGAAIDETKEQPEGSCPWNTEDVVCLKVLHPSWMALTCGKIPTDSDISCTHSGDLEICPCPNDYCNSRGWRSVGASVALVATLLSAALAAAW